jgi:hypothetical protein
MADLKRWFKVWTTINNDPHFQELDLDAIGRWVLLGAYIAENGTRGVLSVPAGARRLRELLRVDSVPALKRTLAGLPNLVLSDRPVRWAHGNTRAPVDNGGVVYESQSGLPLPRSRGGIVFAEWCERHDAFAVTLKNWTKFQVDTTQAQRQQASRSKKRREEMRREPPNPPLGKTVTRNPNHGQHCQCERCEAARQA